MGRIGGSFESLAFPATTAVRTVRLQTFLFRSACHRTGPSHSGSLACPGGGRPHLTRPVEHHDSMTFCHRSRPSRRVSRSAASTLSISLPSRTIPHLPVRQAQRG
jgi:hypothetical protein